MEPTASNNETDQELTYQSSWKKYLKRTLWEIAQTALLSALLFAVINLATIRILVQSVSMQPTLYESDRVLVNRLAYIIGTPARKDVIVFDPPVSNIDEPYIKRIIGLPGDKVRITNGKVYVNDLPLQETYIAAPPGYAGSWDVPPGHGFVLGDNRNNSYDSHYWGVVALESIIGKAEFVFWPYSHIKVLNPSNAAAAGDENPEQ
jgi:signal peptidase I